MDSDSLTEAVALECGSLIFALDEAENTARVPACPEWTMGDLATHVGNFCGFWSHILCEATGRPKAAFSDPTPGEYLVPWVAQWAGSLIEELEATPADTAVWTWFDADHTAAFVSRRAAHEIAVHRYDAQSASGSMAPIPAELAADGIDEVLDVLSTIGERGGDGTGRVMALRSTDIGLEWLVTLNADAIGVERRWQDDEPFEGSSLIISGTASDLELTLYGRPTLGAVDTAGDGTVLGEWHRTFRF